VGAWEDGWMRGWPVYSMVCELHGWCTLWSV